MGTRKAGHHQNPHFFAEERDQRTSYQKVGNLGHTAYFTEARSKFQSDARLQQHPLIPCQNLQGSGGFLQSLCKSLHHGFWYRLSYISPVRHLFQEDIPLVQWTRRGSLTLVCDLDNCLFFHIYIYIDWLGIVIISIDLLIFFRGVGQPP